MLTDELEPWTPRTIGATLAAVAGARPEAEAIVAADGRASYGDLHERARRAAAGLARLGVSRGDHVAVCMENSVEWLAVFYGCALLGAVVVPVNTRFKAAELAYCLEQSDATALVLVDRFLGIDFLAMLRSISPAPGRLRTIIARGTEVPAGAHPYEVLTQPVTLEPAGAVMPDDIALIQYTSGSTARPKGVMLTHDSILRNAANAAACIGIAPDDRYFSSRPYFHVAGTTLSILAALAAGATLVTVPVFDVSEVLRVLEAERCTLICGNDTIFLEILAHPRLAAHALRLRGGWAAGDPEVMRGAVERLGLTGLVSAYGLSEAAPNVVMNRHTDPVADRIAGLARPHRGIEVRTVDLESGAITGPGVPGEIQVRGWSLMLGYYNKPAETAETLVDGWLRTGDLGVIDQEGRLRFVARAKDMLRVGGENVAPADVEQVLHGHPKVRQAQVVGVPDARLGEVVAAYVVLKEGAVAEPQELIAWCKERCANFKVPRHLRIVDTFEDIGMTASNKVQKNRLRERALRDFGIRAAAAST